MRQNKPTRIITKKVIKTLHGKTLVFSWAYYSICMLECRRRFLPPHFVFLGKTKRKLESYYIEVAATQSSPIRGANLFHCIWFWLDKRRDCQALVHKYMYVSKEHWTIATSTINLRLARVSWPCWVSWACKRKRHHCCKSQATSVSGNNSTDRCFSP